MRSGASRPPLFYFAPTAHTGTRTALGGRFAPRSYRFAIAHSEPIYSAPRKSSVSRRHSLSFLFALSAPMKKSFRQTFFQQNARQPQPQFSPPQTPPFPWQTPARAPALAKGKEHFLKLRGEKQLFGVFLGNSPVLLPRTCVFAARNKRCFGKGRQKEKKGTKTRFEARLAFFFFLSPAFPKMQKTPKLRYASPHRRRSGNAPACGATRPRLSRPALLGSVTPAGRDFAVFRTFPQCGFFLMSFFRQSPSNSTF